MLGFVDCVWYDDSQGLASCLLEQFGSGECGKRGVVVGYDARHNSRRLV